MANVTYTVVAGDTLISIAKKYNTTVTAIANLNHIQNVNLIYVGQFLIISGTADAEITNTTNKAIIRHFGLQSNTDRTVFATWIWDKANTENYEVKWYYNTGDGVDFIGSESTVDDRQSIYNAPENAEYVRFVVKPMSKTYKNKNQDVSYWTANWSTEVKYYFVNNPPQTPPVPSVSIDKFLLEAELDNLGDLNADVIHFQVVKDHYTIFTTSNTTIREGFNYARFTCYVDAGGEYKVRCRTSRGDLYSDWSNFSSSVSTIPSAPSSITVCRASSETSVYLEWGEVSSAKTYELEYTTKKEYFDGSDQTTTVTGIEFTHYEKTGLESGQEYFFRVRAANDQGSSSWSDISSVIIGKAPAAPTTWSSTTTAIVGEPLNLYWIHNSEDESTQRYAQVELYINGAKSVVTINSVDEEDDKKTMHYAIDTSAYSEGVKIQWRVRTAGVTTYYGDWSIQRTVDIYAPPTLVLSVTDLNVDPLESLDMFPFYISGSAGPATQNPIGYHVTVTANEFYETVDNLGNVSVVNPGSEVYSKYFDITSPLVVQMSAGNIDLENNISYTVTCTVSMDSGLTAENSYTFKVAWTDISYEPNAEISIDSETITASIRPYCEDEHARVIEGVTLSVYRREFDGSFTELATGVPNDGCTFITDPHPALDFARYRVVAITDATGAVSYYDIPGYPVGEKAVIIQWNETWSWFDTKNEDDTNQPSWSGSMLKLPYNIDISDDHKTDVSLVEYIGRRHPVSYYGTQVGETSSWNVEIDKSDKETLYALRRLAIWMGDVYVREPSGSGYWASISVSFSQKHCEVTIPVTLRITRVAGGV